MRKTTLKALAARFALRTEGAGPSAAEIAANVASIMQRNNNDASKAVEQLLGENAKLREDKRKLKEQNEQLLKDAPQDGELILTKDEGAQWEAYCALGKPEDLKKQVEEHKTLSEKVAQSEKAKLVEEAAKAAGFKASVLEKLADGLAIEMKDVPKQNEKGETVQVRVAFVKTDTGLKPLVDHAQENWPDFLPSLKESAQPGTQAHQNGVQYPNNGGGGQQPQGGNVVDTFIQQANESRSKGTNPLMPQSTGAK